MEVTTPPCELRRLTVRIWWGGACDVAWELKVCGTRNPLSQVYIVRREQAVLLKRTPSIFSCLSFLLLIFIFLLQCPYGKMMQVMLKQKWKIPYTARPQPSTLLRRQIASACDAVHLLPGLENTCVRPWPLGLRASSRSARFPSPVGTYRNQRMHQWVKQMFLSLSSPCSLSIKLINKKLKVYTKFFVFSTYIYKCTCLDYFIL